MLKTLITKKKNQVKRRGINITIHVLLTYNCAKLFLVIVKIALYMFHLQVKEYIEKSFFTTTDSIGK